MAKETAFADHPFNPGKAMEGTCWITASTIRTGVCCG